MSDFGELRTVTARKVHRCAWCGEPIEAGESCKHYKGLWRDDWQNWRMHHECLEAYEEEGDYDGFALYDNERPTPPPAAPGHSEEGEKDGV